MADKTGTTKSGDPIALFIDEENQQYVVVWGGLCGYDSVGLGFASAHEAEKAFEALLNVIEVDPD